MPQTTGKGLSSDQLFLGLVDYGLFSEKLPPCLTSKNLSTYAPATLLALETEGDEKKLRNLVQSVKHDYVRYELLRDINVPRQMGIPHPESYIAQCLALKRHWQDIKSHCAKPKYPVSRVYVRRTDGHRVFRMNYEGCEQNKNRLLDVTSMAGARYVVHTDIANFFPSIYSHSVPWAMHGKSRSKGKFSLLMSGNLLDKTTQNTRDGQTNGLLIGPHSSNVISEILLTSVDTRMLQKGYRGFYRHIDDYTFYATNHEQAEDFLADLGKQLREYELVLNGHKTKILRLPLPMSQDWRRRLKAFNWPDESATVGVETILTFLDLAVELAREAGTSSVLNYAFKIVPQNLHIAAKRFFVQYATNLALLFPYLALVLEEHVFEKCFYSGIEEHICKFSGRLLETGIDRNHADAVSSSLYYAVKHDVTIDGVDPELVSNLWQMNDCLSLLLLFEYGKRKGLAKVCKSLRNRVDSLKGTNDKEKDRNWLLIYQVWSQKTLEKEGQNFLAELKGKDYSFLCFS